MTSSLGPPRPALLVARRLGCALRVAARDNSEMRPCASSDEPPFDSTPAAVSGAWRLSVPALCSLLPVMCCGVTSVLCSDVWCRGGDHDGRSNVPLRVRPSTGASRRWVATTEQAKGRNQAAEQKRAKKNKNCVDVSPRGETLLFSTTHQIGGPSLPNLHHVRTTSV